MPSDQLPTGEVNTSIKYIQRDIEEIKGDIKSLHGDFVTNDRFQSLEDKVTLVQRIVFGMIGLILMAVVSGILASVIRIKP